MDKNATIDISCPKCGEKIAKSIAWLETNDTLGCTACGGRITLDNIEELRATFGDVEKGISDFISDIGKLNR